MAVTAGKILLPEVGSATHYHAHLCKPDWGHDEEGHEDRHAHLLPHLWRRMELTVQLGRCATAARRRFRPSAAANPARTMSHFPKYLISLDKIVA